MHNLARAGISSFKETDVAYVLSGDYSKGDTEKAYELLVLLDSSEQGLIQSYNPDIKLLGAVNREGVTCYLDALLFAMFARLGSFETMLYKKFEDPTRKRLATLLRLWVNALRAGRLITVDIVCIDVHNLSRLRSTDIPQTKQIQLQLSNCGWEEAAEVCQQDASEAFTFITSTLGLPLLTLKMDIFHTGREDASDDHKLVNERLLELALPDDPVDGHSVTLEECLELYFNNRIEVKRYLDQLERRNTLNSLRSRPSVDASKAHASHVEVAEIGDLSPPSSPIALSPQPSAPPVTPIRPLLPRQRAPSIIQEHYLPEKTDMLELSPTIDEKGEPSPRSARVRKEVVMPAWQFFSLIPWYTNSVPSNDAQVAAHFSSTRPILGICLKRYSIQPNGTSVKRTLKIDIPLEIALPHFIQDDQMGDDGPAFGNFKLSLQSVVCHQGNSTESGHYISLVRCPDPGQPGEDRWMRFDDLATERVTYTDVEAFLSQESPYLLFYQVIPIEGDPGNVVDGENGTTTRDQPPTYSESTASWESKVDSGVAGVSTSVQTSRTSVEDSTTDSQRPSLDVHRPSIEIAMADVGRQDRPDSVDEQRHSMNFLDVYASARGSKVDLFATPNADLNHADGPNTLTVSRRGSKTALRGSKIRSSSRDDKRLSTSLSRLASRMSKDRLNKPRDNNHTSGSTTNLQASGESRNGSTTAYNQGHETPASSRPPSRGVPDRMVAPPDQVKDTSAPSLTVQSVAVTASNEKALAAGEQPPDRGKVKKEAKEKSKAAYRDYQHLMKGKRKEAKPDRECSVM